MSSLICINCLEKFYTRFCIVNAQFALSVNLYTFYSSFFRPSLLKVLKNYLFFILKCSVLDIVYEVGRPPFIDDFARHPVLQTHLPDRIINVIGGSYTHVHTLPHPKWHKTKYTNFMAMNKQRKVRFI
jgi:hypothetical protein